MAEKSAKKQRAERVASTIQFPHTDLSDAIGVAEGLLKSGGVPLSRDQLAAALGLSPNGGGFAKKVATARTFGVIEPTSGKYQLSDLGFEIVDPVRQQDAKAKAFLCVELYRRLYEEFRGRLLPPRPHGLENTFVTFGVSPKSANAARLAFEKSARLAGFFPSAAEDRLVMPFGLPAAPATSPDEEAPQSKSLLASTVSTPPPRAFANSDIHPSIIGMVEELPPPKEAWSKAEQADWLQALATMFRVIYKSTDAGTIEVKFIESPPPVRRQPDQ